MKNDYEGVKEVYQSYVSSGGRPWPGLQILVARVLRKHNQEVPFKVPERGQRTQQSTDMVG